MKKNRVHGTPEQFQHEVERKIAELTNSSIDSSTDVNSSTNKTILSRLSKSGYTIKEVRKMFEDQTGLEMTSDHSREFNEWAEDFLRLIERSTNIEASINLSDDEIERYIHTLIGDIQSEFEGIVDSMKFDTTDDSLIITAVLGNEVKEFTVPYSDLKFDWNNIDEDIQYICNEIDEEFNREYVDDVISESTKVQSSDDADYNMKRYVRSSLIDLLDISRKEAFDKIDTLLKSADYIQVSYYDPFAKDTKASAFMRQDDGRWSWVTGKNGKIMNEGTPNENNSINLSEMYVRKELRYVINNLDARYLSYE